MSSSSSISATTQGLPIPELIELIKHSFRECEEKMKIETNSLKGKVSLLELEKSSLEEKLQVSEKTITAKDRLILDLNQKINELKNKNMENERFFGVYHEKFKCLDATLVKMNKEIDDLRPEKLAADQKTEVSVRKQFGVDRNVEANRDVDEWRRRKYVTDNEPYGSNCSSITAPKEAKDPLVPLDSALLLEPNPTFSFSVQNDLIAPNFRKDKNTPEEKKGLTIEGLFDPLDAHKDRVKNSTATNVRHEAPKSIDMCMLTSYVPIRLCMANFANDPQYYDDDDEDLEDHYFYDEDVYDDLY